MDKATIYHNPRCSKSRQALQYLEEKGIEVNIINYLDNPPSAKKITEILTLLNIEPRDLMRKNEPLYKSLGLNNPNLTKKSLIEAITQNPILLERPVVIYQNKAVIGRSFEKLMELV